MANKNKWTAPLRERDITRQIAREYFQEFDRLIEILNVPRRVRLQFRFPSGLVG